MGSVKWNRQFGIRQSGIRQSGTNSLVLTRHWF